MAAFPVRGSPGIVGGFLLGIAAASPAGASINVEFRPSFQTVNVGATVNIGIYLVSDSASPQGLAAAQVIFNWQTTFLQMLSNSNTGAYPLLSSAFPSPDPYGLNELTTPQDGNAMWVGLASFGSPALAAPGAGTLMTTLRFTALAQTSSTPLSILALAGSPTGNTVVYDGTVPNLGVTGSLTGATVQIVPAPGAIVPVDLLALGWGAGQRRRR